MSDTHPWFHGREEMERMFGDLAMRRRQWMTIAMIAMTVSIVLAVGMVTLVTTDRNVPWIIEVDELGSLRFAGEVATQDVPERVRLAVLHRVIHDMRQIPRDGRLLAVQHEYALAHLAGNAAAEFTRDLADNQDLLQQHLRNGTRRYVKEVSSILPFPGQPGFYRATWVEETVGSATQRTSYEGHFNVQVSPEPRPDQVLLNPMGITITDYSITTVSTGS